MIKVKLIPAGYGMSLLISVGKNPIFNILYDGGTKDAYSNCLKKEIEALTSRNERLNLVICSHIDYDHICGLIKLLDEGYGAYIDELWYNGFLQIINEKYYNRAENDKTKHDMEIINNLIQSAVNMDDQHNIGLNDLLTLGVLSIEKNITINSAEKGSAICVKDNSSIGRYKIGNAELIILGPTKDCLNRMEKRWGKEMISKGFHFNIADKVLNTKAFEMIMERIKMNYSSETVRISNQDDLNRFCDDMLDTDESITNESSISVIIKNNDRSILVLGDSVIDKAFLDRIEKAVGRSFKFDAIQLPHHGSRYNLSREFIERYIAKEYYVLTNSKKFDHPDICVLANIAILNRDAKSFVFNYPIEKAKFLCRKDWQDKYNYCVCLNEENKSIERTYL